MRRGNGVYAFDLAVGAALTTMILPRVLSVLLALAGIAFGIVGGGVSVKLLTPYSSWPKVDAIVDEINVHTIGDNKYGTVRMKLRYGSGSAERSAWADRSFLPGRRE